MDQAFQIRGNQEDFEAVMAVPPEQRESVYHQRREPKHNGTPGHYWADQAFQIRGSQEDFEAVMAVPPEQQESVYHQRRKGHKN